MEQINTDFVRLGKCQTGVVTNQARVERALFLPTFVRMNEDIFEGIPYLAWYIIIYTLLLSAGTFFICVKDFFFWGGDGGAWRASGCQKGAADEPLRGRLTYKP